jgi:hypothetical protein
MINEVKYSFRTKTGICVVSPERLVLTREGTTGKVGKFLFGKSVRRGLVIYGVIGTIALIFGIWQIIENNYASGVFLLLIGIYLYWNVIASWNNSSLNQIERSTVESIDIQPPKPPVTRGYFTINFRYNGKKQKRLIMLPGSVSGGNEEYKKALSIMKEMGWL